MSLKTLTDAWENSPYSGNALLVHLAIADVVNSDHEYHLFMLIDAIAEKARVSRATVKRVRAQMVEDGWLVPIDTGKLGRGRPSEYAYVLGGAPTSGEVAQDEPLPEVAHQAQESGSPGPGSGSDGESSPLSEHKNSRGELNARATPFDRPFEAHFDETWKHYPRKLSREAAYKAYVARRREGVEAELLHVAVLNYADERAGEDESYTMHGATFFGPKRRWCDYLVAKPVRRRGWRNARAELDRMMPDDDVIDVEEVR